jgi:hypothetical protein
MVVSGSGTILMFLSVLTDTSTCWPLAGIISRIRCALDDVM